MSYINVNEENFESEVLQSDIPVLIDFWAPWCQFCLVMSEIVEEIADELDGKVKVCKFNCDEAQELAISYGVSSIPAFMMFKDGEKKDVLVGAMSEEDLLSFIEDNV